MKINAKCKFPYTKYRNSLVTTRLVGGGNALIHKRCPKARVWILQTIGGEPPIVLILFAYISFEPWNDPIYIAKETVVVKVVTSHK